MIRRLMTVSIPALLVIALAASGWARKLKGDLAKQKFEWAEITDADWEIPADSIYQGHDAIMLFERIDADDKKFQNDECYRQIYRRIRVVGEGGREWADGEVPFIHEDQEIKALVGRTVLRDGTVIPLLDENIHEKEAVKTEDQKINQVTFSIPGVTDDCIVEYMIKIEAQTYQPNWIVQKDIPVKESYMHWTLAEFQTIAAFVDLANEFVTPNYLLLNRYSDMKIKHIPSVKDAKEMTFTIGETPAFEDEPHSFPEDWARTKLVTYYSSNQPSAAYWGKQATNIDKNIKEFSEKNGKLQDVVAEFGEIADDDTKIKAAYDWVTNNIKHTSQIRAENEALAGGKKLYKDQKEIKIKDNDHIDDIIQHGYGTRYQITLAFVDMLREMNIQADPAFVVDRSEDIFTEQIKYWQFDVYLVAVKQNGKNFFYAPAYAYMPIGYVPWYAEGVTALVTGNDDFLQPVPFSQASDNSILCSYEYTIGDDLSLSGNGKSRRSGHPARYYRLELRNEDSVDHRKILTEDLAEDYTDVTIDSAMCEGFDGCDAPLKLAWHCSFPALQEQGNLLLITPFNYFTTFENEFTKEDRRWPILFNYAYEIKESGKIDVPDGWTIKAVPGDTTFENSAGKIATSIQQMGNSLVIQRVFTLSAPFLRADGYKHARDLMTSRQDLSSAVVVLEKSI